MQNGGKQGRGHIPAQTAKTLPDVRDPPEQEDEEVDMTDI